MKTLTAYAAGWFAALCLLLLFASPLLDRLFFFYPLLHWGMVLAGAVIFICAVFSSAKMRHPCIPALALPVLGLLLFFTVGFELGRKGFFQIRKSHYEQLLAEAEKTGEIPGSAGHVDEGPPRRFAFYWQRGITDNWAGVVYDPTGDVMQVNEMPDMNDLHNKKWADIVRLFGGDLHRCERLQGHWYLCWFT